MLTAFSPLQVIALLSVVAMSCFSIPTPPMDAQDILFRNDMASRWSPLNDGVMGGLSEGQTSFTDSTMLWTGQTRLENNGGFASVRSPWGHTNLQSMKGVTIRCKGHGGSFKLTLETSERWWMPYAYASFTPSGDWQDVVLEVNDFSWSQAQMGDLKSVSPARELSDVLRIGLMKYDGTAQPFELEVASIRFLEE
jgi:hypothetical protein